MNSEKPSKRIRKALVLSGGGARGAFEVGVLQYLSEIGWKPDLICGTSAGAVNAAAYGSGMSVDNMKSLWKTYHRKRMYKLTLPSFLRALKGSTKTFSPLSDTRPLKSLLEQNIDIQTLNKSDTEILITALNMHTAQVCYFSHKVIGIDHLMAASAIPMLFPWSYIDGVPFWDAGLMVNTPITPAIELGAEQIISVLLSPVGAFTLAPPTSMRQAAELTLEHFLLGSFTASLPNSSFRVNPGADYHETPLPGSAQLQLSGKNTRFGVVAPTRMLGFKSLLNFSPRQAETLIREGYNNARMQLQGFLL